MAINWDEHVLGPVHAVFGETVTFLPRGRTGFDIVDAVYDEAHLQVVVLDDGQPANSTAPALGVREASFPPGPLPQQNDRVQITVRGVRQTFVVKDVQPDGKGETKLLLNHVKTG